jgi:hypothetical protein
MTPPQRQTVTALTRIVVKSRKEGKSKLLSHRLTQSKIEA